MENILKKCTEILPIFEGGQKKVFKAKHKDFGEVVLKYGSFYDASGLERINREVNLLKDINSDYFPRNYEFVIDKNQKTFLIVEEFIESKKLNELTDYYDSEQQLIPLLRELIQGLKVLWDRNVVHRDLKPDNILITPNFQPKIIDLGIARFREYTSLTNTIAEFGPCTKMYASPEQLQNRKRAINLRTDFFALGIIILELYLGFHPFMPDRVGNSQSIPENIVSGIYVKPSTKDNTSIKFESLINRLLKTQPHQRFPNYQTLEKFITQYWS
ncbi:MAG: serine/threonine protein kinase [Tissierellales bacterium]|nr:serine/threonine protein kinase [Tissierellales bacterium]